MIKFGPINAPRASKRASRRQFDTEIHGARCIINYASQVNIDITARGRWILYPSRAQRVRSNALLERCTRLWVMESISWIARLAVYAVTRADVTASACIVTECFATSFGHMAPAIPTKFIHFPDPDWLMFLFKAVVSLANHLTSLLQNLHT